MSHAAIAAVLASEDLATSERLVAFSLASFANSEHLAWPGTPAAAARAGLGRGVFLAARDRLVARGVVVVEDVRGGRGQASVVRLVFALRGPWWEGGVNAQLLELVLAHSPARGPARLLLAVMAALAEHDGTVEGVSTEELRRAAGLADSTYRRARAALLGSGELVLVEDGGGRGRTNRWRIPHAHERGFAHASSHARPSAPGPGRRSVLTSATSTSNTRLDTEVLVQVRADRSGAGIERRAFETAGKGPAANGVSGANGPSLSGVSASEALAPRGDLGGNLMKTGLETPPQTPPETPPQTPPETPPEAPAETPPLNVRAGREALNPLTQDPPSPAWRGGAPPPAECWLRRASERLVAVSAVSAVASSRSTSTRSGCGCPRRALLICGIGSEHGSGWPRSSVRACSTCGLTRCGWLRSTVTARS